MSFHQMDLAASIQNAHGFLCGKPRAFDWHDQSERRNSRHAVSGRTLLSERAATEDPVGQMEVRKAININIAKLRGFKNRVSHSQPLLCDYDDQITARGNNEKYFERFQKIRFRNAPCVSAAHSTFLRRFQPGVAA